MSKAEERAKEYAGKFVLTVDHQSDVEEAYLDGYHQAEQDSELTLEDIKQICDIEFEEACMLQRNMKSSCIYKEQHYQIVLKRFKEGKKNSITDIPKIGQEIPIAKERLKEYSEINNAEEFFKFCKKHKIKL